MAKKKFKKGLVTKTEEPKTNLIVNELNLMSADRSRKDISNFHSALQAAEAIEFPNRVQLYNLYDDITLDGHLSGVISKRIDAVVNKKLRYVNPSGKRLDEMDKIIRSMTFRNTITEIILSKFWGIRGMEFVPGEKFCFERIPVKHIKPEKGIITLDQSGDDGISYEGISNIWMIGENKDLGLLLKCAPYALYKRGNMADWSQYIELFGQPVRIVKYDAYDEKTKIELRQVLDESGSSLALMIPKQADFDMKDGKQSNGTGELQERFKIALDAEMSVIILGNTETTTSSKSSGYAQSKEHGKQQLEVTKSDLEFVVNHLNDEKFIKILKSYALPIVEGGTFEFEKEIDLEELKAKAEVEKIVQEAYGTPVDDDYVYETYGIPKPANYAELKAKQQENRDPANPAPPAPGKPVPPKAKKKIEDQGSPSPTEATPFVRWLRIQLADFFDPAP
jgi:hypothetical protein